MVLRNVVTATSAHVMTTQKTNIDITVLYSHVVKQLVRLWFCVIFFLRFSASALLIGVVKFTQLQVW
jgi:hypothetical protein